MGKISMGSKIIYEDGGGGGSTTFTDLTDTPVDYINQGGKTLTVKADESGVDFQVASSGGVAENGLPVGGVAGQVLAKVDDTNFNANWVDGGGGGQLEVVTELPETAEIGDSVIFKDGYGLYNCLFDGVNWYRSLAYNSLDTGNFSYLANELSALFIGGGTLKLVTDVNNKKYALGFRVVCPHNQITVREWTFNTTTDGMIKIHWEQEGEVTTSWYDYTVIYIDGVELTRQQNMAYNQYHEKFVTAGEHTIKFTFNRDSSGSGGYNGFQIYEISIPK